MPMEHYRYTKDNTVGLYQGYYCMNCGAGGLAMYGSSKHGYDICEPNPELVEELNKLNNLSK